jgi:hypothetical protein
MPTVLFSSSDGPFATRSPKPDQLKVVKLTKQNLKEVAAYVMKNHGGVLEVRSGTLVIDGTLFTPGDYLVEEYDHGGGFTNYRVATLDERTKYDLR